MHFGEILTKSNINNREKTFHHRKQLLHNHVDDELHVQQPDSQLVMLVDYTTPLQLEPANLESNNIVKKIVKINNEKHLILEVTSNIKH